MTDRRAIAFLEDRPVQSAGGLFRALGHTSHEQPPREKLDFYPTPPEPVRAIIHAERAALSRYPSIWEPAVGDGAISAVLEAEGWSVAKSDLVDRGAGADIRDFFDYRAAPSPAILTNPPFSEVNWRDGRGRWIDHAMGALGVEYMALLLSWSWPGAAGLGHLWERYPPARVYLMRWKIDFTGGGAPPMLNGWFVWDRRAPVAPTSLLMLDRVRGGADGDLFGEGAA